MNEEFPQRSGQGKDRAGTQQKAGQRSKACQGRQVDPSPISPQSCGRGSHRGLGGPQWSDAHLVGPMTCCPPDVFPHLLRRHLCFPKGSRAEGLVRESLQLGGSLLPGNLTKPSPGIWSGGRVCGEDLGALVNGKLSESVCK